MAWPVEETHDHRSALRRRRHGSVVGPRRYSPTDAAIARAREGDGHLVAVYLPPRQSVGAPTNSSSLGSADRSSPPVGCPWATAPAGVWNDNDRCSATAARMLIAMISSLFLQENDMSSSIVERIVN